MDEKTRYNCNILEVDMVNAKKAERINQALAHLWNAYQSVKQNGAKTDLIEFDGTVYIALRDVKTHKLAQFPNGLELREEVIGG